MRYPTSTDEEIVDDWAEADHDTHPRFNGRVMAAFARYIINLRHRVEALEGQAQEPTHYSTGNPLGLEEED